MLRPTHGVAALAILAGTLFAGCGGEASPSPAVTAEGTPFAGPTQTVEMKSFAYVPKEVRVKAGQTVQFRLLSTDIDHTFTVRDLKIDVLGKPGRPVVQELTLTAPGTYRVVCAIAGHEGAGMAGTLVVE